MTNSRHCIRIGTLLLVLASAPALAATDAATDAATGASSTMTVASLAASSPAATVGEAASHPAMQTGVRRAAAQGNEALRRYIWRTRMIHNFYFADFANKD